MAKAAKAAGAIAEKKTGGALTTWDAELAKYAGEVAKQEEGTLFGNLFSLKAGVLSFQNTPIPGNQMEVVILDHIHDRAYFKDKYDSDNPSGPYCYALSKDGVDMAPSDKSVEKQSERCATCQWNKMGSSDTGRGKACREGRRIAIVSAKSLDTVENIAKATVAYMKTPPTSIVPFATYVKNLGEVARRPPFSVLTNVKLVPDKETQYKLEFDMVRNLPQGTVQALIEKREATKTAIFYDYQAPRDPDAEDKKKSRQASQRPTNPQGKKANGKAAPAKKTTAPPPTTKGTTKSGARKSAF